MKRKLTFKQAKKRRNALIKRYLKADKQLTAIHKKLVAIEDVCVSTAKWGDSFERFLKIDRNFSVYED